MVRSSAAECRRPSRITVAERAGGGGWRCRRPARSPSIVAAPGRTIRIRCRRSEVPELASRALITAMSRDPMPALRSTARRSGMRFGVVIVEAIDIGGTVGFILMARRVPPAIDAVTIPANRDRWRSGLTVLVESGFADAPAYDPVIVCGGPGWGGGGRRLCPVRFPAAPAYRVHRLCLHWRVGPGRHRRTRWAGCHGPPPCRRR